MVTQPQPEYQTAVAWGMLNAGQQGLVKNELLDPTQHSLEGILGVSSLLEQDPTRVLGQLPNDPQQRETMVNAKKTELDGKLNTYLKLMVAEPLAKAYGITNVDQVLNAIKGNIVAYLPLLAMLRGAMLIKAYETAPADVKGQVGAALVGMYASNLTQAAEQMTQRQPRAQRNQAG